MFLFLLGTIFSDQANATPPSPIPDQALYVTPLSDPFAPNSSLTVRSSSDSEIGVTGRLGINQPLAQYNYGPIKLQVGLMATAYMGFKSDGDMTFGLRTFDGIIGIPISAETGDTIISLRWLHLSSHYADGIRLDSDMPSNIGATSQESLEVSLSKKWGWVTGHQRIEWRYHSVHETSPFVGGFGLDVCPEGRFAPYASAFLLGDLNGGGFSGEAGLMIEGDSPVRLGISGYTGRGIPGKLMDVTDKYLGLTFVFGN